MPAPEKGYRLEPKPRPSGYWYFRGPHMQPKTTGCKDRRQAEKWLAQFIIDLGDGAKATGGEVTIRMCFDLYDHNKIELHVKNKVRLRRRLLRTCEFFGFDTVVNLENLNQQRLNDFWRWRRKQPNGQGGVVKDGTIRQDLFDFKTVLNYAVGANKLDSRLIPQKIEYPPKGQSRKRVLTVLELEMIFEAARHSRGGLNRLPAIYLLCVILAATGRRRRAVEQLAWTQVKWDAGVIEFLPDGEVESTKVKGTVPISTFLLPILKQAYQERTTDFVMGNPKPERGATFSRIVKRLGIKDVVPHTLRHTFGSWLAYKGYSIPEIAHAMDCTEETARANYVHFNDKHKRDAVENVIPIGIKTHVERSRPAPKPRPKKATLTLVATI